MSSSEPGTNVSHDLAIALGLATSNVLCRPPATSGVHNVNFDVRRRRSATFSIKSPLLRLTITTDVSINDLEWITCTNTTINRRTTDYDSWAKEISVGNVADKQKKTLVNKTDIIGK